MRKVFYEGTVDEWVQIDFADWGANGLGYAEKLYIDDELVTEINITTATRINNWAFYKCDTLKEVILENCVKCIGAGAFGECESLEDIVISDSVTYIRWGAFKGCCSLESATFENPYGWYADGEKLTLTDDENNAYYLNNDYCECEWERK